MSENIDISNSLDKLSLHANADKKRYPRAKYNMDSKKKYKQSFFQESSKVDDKNSSNAPKLRALGQISVLQKNKGQQPSTHRPSKISNRKAEWSVYKFNVTNQDIDVCRATAVSLNSVRESIEVDPVLFHNLNMLAFSTAQHMFDQQRNAFAFQEQLKQAEVLKWLSSRTEEERKEYFESHFRSK